MSNKLFVFVVIMFWALFVKAQNGLWEWHTEVKGGIDKSGPARAFLWIPDNCKQLKGVVLAQHNMEEISILENPLFRKGMAELDFAIVWCHPSFDHLFRFNQGAGETFQNIMNELAEASGYPELKVIPIAGIGHSAAASWPYYFAAWKPERTLCAISVSGQWPYFRHEQWAPDIWGDRTIDYVPCLETMGEYEAANTWSLEGLKERQEHPLTPLSMLACPAEGHFAATDEKVEYLVFYIRKAIQYRMTDGELPLKKIDPAKSGWLADKWRINQKPTAQAAPVADYGGNRAEAFWFFDEQLARKTEEYQASYRGRKVQLPGYLQNGKVLPQRNSHLQVLIPFLPENDGISFRLSGTFLDTVPGESPRPEQWTRLKPGSPVGHALNGEAVSVNKICGPFEKVSTNEFLVAFDRTCYQSKADRFELCFTATHPGDKVFKPAVQQAQLFIPAKLTEGDAQQITFPLIKNQKAGQKEIKLKATSTSGLQVRYYVVSGPVVVHGNQLIFTKIPPQSKFPIKITLVAWQYGRSMGEKIQSAEPVEQSFWINEKYH